MRTLHWSSTSFGYMKPSTPDIMVASLLAAQILYFSTFVFVVEG
jgi:hypothetical protein